jgi:hypothetical protein
VIKTANNQAHAALDQFLVDQRIRYSTEFKGDRCPLNCNGTHNHGDRYSITFSRYEVVPAIHNQSANGETIYHTRSHTITTFSVSYWNSPSESKDNITPRIYDVLNSMTKNDPGNFEKFCILNGYNFQSLLAMKAYKIVKKEWLQVMHFFSEDEILVLRSFFNERG